MKIPAVLAGSSGLGAEFDLVAEFLQLAQAAAADGFMVEPFEDSELQRAEAIEQ